MPQAKKTTAKKISFSNRLYRSRTERMIGGVCGGVAEYFNVDITLVRIIWVISIFAQGLGVVVYLAGLIIIPDNPSTSATQVKKSKAAENTMLIIGAVIIALGVYASHVESAKEYIYSGDFADELVKRIKEEK